MSDLNELFKQLAEAKRQDPKYQKSKAIEDQVKESVKADFGSLLSQISAAKAEDPVYQKHKKIEDQVKESIKGDLGNLFSELASLKKQKTVMVEQHPELAQQPIETPVEFEPQLVEEVLTEVSPLPTPVGVVPPEAQIPELDKYLNTPSTKVEEPNTYAKEFKTVNDKIKFLEQWIGKIQNAGPGSGEVNLRYLDDVDRSTIADGKYLNYNATTKKFQFSDVTVSGSVGTLDQVTDNGNTTTNAITVGSATADWFKVQLNPAVAPVVTTGMIAWNPQDNTFDMGLLNGVTLQAGQEMHMYVKANEAISNGQSVMFAGSSGEHILVRKYDSSVTGFIGEWFIGVATQDLVRNEFGYITVYGKVHDINTNAWNVGTILYADNDVVGGLTPTPPAPGKPHIIVAAVTKKSGTGHLMVRPSVRPALADLPDVGITSAASGEVLTFNGTVWANSVLPSSVTWTNTDIGPANNFKTIIGANDGYASITILEGVPGLGSSYSWKFDKTKITFPDNSTQTTAWTGTYSYTNLTDKPTLFSGSYTDLTNKPTLFSGSYTDLTNKPTIPSLTGYATETFVNTAISNVVGAAPDALNTLKEIADQLAADESGVAALTTTVAGKVSLTGSYANPDWITSLAYSKLTGAPTIPTVPTTVSSFTNDAGYLTSADANSLTGTTLKSTVVSSSLTSVGTLTSLAVSGTGVTVGAKLTMFDDGNAHIHTTAGNLWLNAGTNSNVSINTQTSGNVELGNTTSMNCGYGSVAPVFGVRAWISCGYVNGNMVTNGSGNLSVTRTAAGKYNFTFTDRNMPDGNYCVTATAKTPNDNSDVAVNVGYNTNTTTTGFTIHTARYGSGFVDVPQLFVQVVR